jgi:GNAT superfamily N-acetyltransferase
MDISFDEYVISDNKERLNVETIHGFLSRSYWANNRERDRTVKSIQNSICFGMYHGERQIGYARVITDEATMFYLCDVFIDEEYRGKSLGKKLIETIINYEKFGGLTSFLGTLDAHGLYEQFGFVKDENRFMKRLPIV